MQIIVSDACIIIDIEYANLSSAMLSMSYQFIVPDILYEEELLAQHSNLLKIGLKVAKMEPDLIAETYLMRQQYTRPSTNDLFALVLAKHNSCLLLTGDKNLKKVADKLHVENHGTIWLVKQMLTQNKVTIDVARRAFKRMKTHGSRLPWEKVDDMLLKEEASINNKDS